MPAETLAEDGARARTEFAGPQLPTRALLIELAGVQKVYRMGKRAHKAELRASRASGPGRARPSG